MSLLGLLSISISIMGLSEWNISILKMTSEIHVFAFIPSVCLPLLTILS